MSILTTQQVKSLAIYSARLKGLSWSFDEAGKHAELIREFAETEPKPLYQAMAKVAREVWLAHPDNPGWE